MTEKMLLRPVLRPGRLAWLRRIAAEGSAPIGHDRAAFECRELGWTEWEVTTDGSPNPYTGREVLTEAGRQVLARHDSRKPAEETRESRRQ